MRLGAVTAVCNRTKEDFVDRWQSSPLPHKGLMKIAFVLEMKKSEEADFSTMEEMSKKKKKQLSSQRESHQSGRRGGASAIYFRAILPRHVLCKHRSLFTQMAEQDKEVSHEHRFAHLLQPIRDLAENWNIDIAKELEDYLEELEHVTFSFDGSSPIQGKSLNFAEGESSALYIYYI
jgi:hypothetical protein